VIKVIFWQETLSIHQAPFMRALASDKNAEIVVNAASKISERRAKMGWTDVDYGNAKVNIAPKENLVTFIRSFIDREAIHTVSGINSLRFSKTVLEVLIQNHQTIGVYSEPFRNDDIKFPLRFIKGFLNTKKYDRGIKFYLPTGEIASKQFQSFSVSKNKIYPFGYFVDDQRSFSYQLNDNDKEVLIGFVGSLSKRKAVDVFLKAVAKTNKTAIKVVIVGDGPQKQKLQELSKEFNIEDRIFWTGTLTNEETKKAISSFDYLVLPSKFDGWGAVVSEALMLGTPVICSDNVGASTLAKKSNYSYSFKRNNSRELASILNDIGTKGKTSNMVRNEIRNWAHNAISPTAASNYFKKIIEHINGASVLKPEAPWCQNQEY
jgi:glycosyltransferase involved in cell wall biosynthesis